MRHLREEKLVQAIKERFWWKEIWRDVKKLLEEYEICRQVAIKRQYQELRPIETLYPFELVSLDTGKITLPTGGEGIFLIAIDYFT